MEPCTYKPVLLTAVSTINIAIPTSMQKNSERLKLLLSSHMLMYPHLRVQDASSGSVESIMMRSALVDPLLTRQNESITCQSSGVSADRLDSPVSPLPRSEPLSDPHCHVQNEYRNEEIPEEDFWVNLVSFARIPVLLNPNIRQKTTVQHFNVCQMLLNSLNFSNILLQYFPGRAIPHLHP